MEEMSGLMRTLLPIWPRVELVSTYKTFPVLGQTGRGTLEIVVTQSIADTIRKWENVGCEAIPWGLVGSDEVSTLFFQELQAQRICLRGLTHVDMALATFSYTIKIQETDQLVSFTYRPPEFPEFPSPPNGNWDLMHVSLELLPNISSKGLGKLLQKGFPYCGAVLLTGRDTFRVNGYGPLQRIIQYYVNGTET
jgi:hypothetical protein